MKRRAQKALVDRVSRLEARLPDPPPRPPEIYLLTVRMIGYHVGRMERRDTLLGAYARALGFATLTEYWQALDAGAAGHPCDLVERHQAALMEMFRQRGINKSTTAEQFKAVLLALDDEVPEWARKQMIPRVGVRDFPELFDWRGGTSPYRPDPNPAV